MIIRLNCLEWQAGPNVVAGEGKWHEARVQTFKGHTTKETGITFKNNWKSIKKIRVTYSGICDM
jgi:hypothetical protein